MKAIYTIGSVGDSGIVCNYLDGRRFEPFSDGEFTNLARAKRAAAELARNWANDQGGDVEIAIVRAVEGDTYPDCVTIVTAKPGCKRATWC